MMAAGGYPGHPGQLQQHPGQPGPQQHLGHPGQPGQPMQHPGLHPQQGQQHAQALYQQQMAQAMANAGGQNPQLHPQQAMAQQHQHQLMLRQRQAQLSGMGVGNAGMAFQAQNGVPPFRGGMPNGIYAGGGPGGVPGAGMGYGVGQPQFANGQPMNPQFQHQLQQQRAQQQQQQIQQVHAQQQAAQLQQQAASAQAGGMQVQPQQMQQATSQQMQQFLQQRALQAQQQANAQAAAQQAALPKQGATILKLHLFADRLSQFDATKGNDVAYWRSFVGEFFSPKGVMRINLYNASSREGKQFEIATPLLARYFYYLFENDVRGVQIFFDGVKETETPTRTGMTYTADSPKTTWIYWFDDGVHVVAQGTSRVQFDANRQIECLDFHTHDHVEYLKRSIVDQLQASPQLMKTSPGSRMQPQKRPQIPDRVSNHFGIPAGCLQFLEIQETVIQMRELMEYSHQRPGLPPKQCLEQFVVQHAQQMQNMERQQMAQQQQQQQQQQQHGPQGPGIPNGIARPGPQGGPQHGGPVPHPGMHPQMMHSPSGNEIRMGGSPHVSVGATPSPAQNHMQAPGMVQQHSQHQHATSNPSSQTSTTVGSANTSPNQTNKRRRASTTSNVKPEGGEDGGGDPTNGVLAAKVKQSPRGNKRAKLGQQNS